VGDADVVGHLHRRLIAFDLDGTLIDSRRDLTDSANQLIEECGGVPLSEEAIGLMIGEGAALLVRRALAAAALPERPDSVARFLAIYDTRLLNHTVAYEGIPEALEAASQAAAVAVLTNKPLAPARRLLDALGLGGRVGSVVGGDGPFPRKPDPTSLQALMAEAGADGAGTLMVGDSAIDLETARRAGVKCCLTAFGFGAVTIQPDRLTGDEWVVQHASELPAVFEAFAAAATKITKTV
jgi:phosphoglycolate phosphatase